MLCVNCLHPLKLDPSLTEKYPEWQTLTAKRTTKSGATVESAVKSGLSTASSSGGPSSDEFSLLNNPAEQKKTGNLSHFITTQGNLLDIIAGIGASAIDHPMCQDCTNALLDCMDQQLNLLEEEYTEYSQLLETLKKCETELDLSCLQRECEKAQSEEQSLRQELLRLDLEEKNLLDELNIAEEEMSKVKQKEEVKWTEYRDLTRKVIDLDMEQQSVENQLKYAQEQLDKLQKTNVFNLAFHIWHNNQFGTINGLRLGRLPTVAVEWSEINAAWGQTCLLLHSLANKIGLKFQRYELVPYGNYSYIRNLEDNKEIPLFCSGGYKYYWDTKFDAGMVAFLDMMQQFKEAIEKGDSQFCMPYRINKDKIIMEESGMANEYSVKVQFNSEERWTKAMKFMLTNLKWALAWVSTENPS